MLLALSYLESINKYKTHFNFIRPTVHLACLSAITLDTAGHVIVLTSLTTNALYPECDTSQRLAGSALRHGPIRHGTGQSRSVLLHQIASRQLLLQPATGYLHDLCRCVRASQSGQSLWSSIGYVG
ncbi:hypothetical protein BgiMline_004492 [Biomphalaria glabrata]|nr:hypothetical protein BgiMline_002599 [Biomphalaria glabrata]KAI8796855.1 hypothetical protein BgiBS90_002032 [Biomphalaria glabrata]